MSYSHGAPDHAQNLPSTLLPESFSGGFVSQGRVGDWAPGDTSFCPGFFFFMDDILLSCPHGEQVKVLPILQG